MINKKRIFVVAGILVILTAIGSGGYLFWSLYEENTILEKSVGLLEQSFGITKTQLENTRKDNSNLTELLGNERGVNENLSKNLEDQFAKNTALESQVVDISGMVKDISGTVGTLQKLSQTDKELLKKYSKIYFLSENYIPSRLTGVYRDYLYDSSVEKKIHAGVEPFLVDMIKGAMQGGVDLKIISAYRSFDEQFSVKTGYKVVYGSGANKFSADQGYSEHQLGTTVDFTTPKLKTLSLQLENDPAYKWLTENAYRFGFVLSYPKGNSYYQYEPWHWRFVGTQLAKRLHDENKYFYDLTQREIDLYLVSIFDR
ncbi:MAG: M15 family metallopeptidase [Candidatus Gracilibacteria bacterium]